MDYKLNRYTLRCFSKLRYRRRVVEDTSLYTIRMFLHDWGGEGGINIMLYGTRFNHTVSILTSVRGFCVLRIILIAATSNLNENSTGTAAIVISQ